MKKKEFIEIVNEDNQPLKIKKERVQAHLDGNWHRTTQIWVVNQKGEILIDQRSKNQYQDPGKWASYFGGHLLLGESYLQGALREIKEELGLKINKKRLIEVEFRKNPGPNEFVQIFLLVLNDIERFKMSDGEIVQWRFVLPDKLLSLVRKLPSDFSGRKEYIKKQLDFLKTQTLI